ncbi:MAG TPA: HEAT repeat domain-containing protein [Pirellulales bacterium]|nr:HEAT repeat domain-containing protein [Pirellulales bacterium]
MLTTDTNAGANDLPRTRRAASVSPDDQLPPVAAPSAGFIVQLFVIPALIVAIIFAIGWGIKWLADRGADPSAYVAALKRDNDGRWQAAHDLADVLRNPRNDHLKDDPALAADLVDALRTQIDLGRLDEQAIELRIYLCNALGEFRVPGVVDILVKAIRLERDPREANVRMAAVKAVAVYLSQVPRALRADPPALLPAIVESSRDERPLMRSTAAFALGAHAGKEATRRLVAMLNDSYPDVRYNAATMLAVQGDLRAADTLLEMLDPAQRVAVETEEQPASRDFKRQLILINALRASKELAVKDPAADLSALRAAVEKLSRADSPAQVRTQAQAVLIEMKHTE